MEKEKEVKMFFKLIVFISIYFFIRKLIINILSNKFQKEMK